MADTQATDYYEVLQISPNAEPETIQRVYRLLAQRYHPDNQETGNANYFRIIREAYSVLSNPDARVKYDVVHATPADRETEKTVRLTILELLSARRRLHPNEPGLFPTEIEKLTGVPREHLEFSTWYLIQKKLAQRSDSSRLIITAEGVDYLDENPHGRSTTPRLTASAERAS
jgi:curved DNA-binding protein CbpA